MTAEQFIDALEKNLILRDHLLAQLRQKISSSGGELTAKSLARYLVKKKYLSKDMASQLLDEPPDDDDYRLVLDEDEPDDEFVLTEPDARDEVPLTPVEDLPDVHSGELIEEQRSDLMSSSVTIESLPESSQDEDSGVSTSAERTPRPESAPKRGGRTRDRERRKRTVKRKNEWDSPLLLIGGGSLILLILCGVTVWYLLFRQTGDEQLNLARTATNQGSYSQAISQYETFLERFPGHAEQSSARVELAMVRLRRATEGRSDHRLALEVAKSEIAAVENEDSFREAHEELATLLPRIARGLADQADAQDDPSQRGTLVELATSALTYCANSKYIPRSLRDDTELFDIRETLARVERRQVSHDDLQATITSMRQAIEAGDTRRAYEAYREFVTNHPGSASDAGVLEMVAKTSAAEQSGIRYVSEEQPAETNERPTVIVASLALARHRDGEPASASGVVCVHLDGALYGLDAKTGRLRWRHFTGFEGPPLVATTATGVLVRDARHNELQLRDSVTGELRWRQHVNESFAQPLVLGDRAYVAAESGRLYVIDVATGTRAGYLLFAQPLRVAPVADPNEERLYLVGEHSSVYAISRSDLACLGVYYLGHPVGSIQASPAAVLGKLTVVVNDGVESSRLHLLSISNEGAIAAEVGQDRLDGLVVTPPLVEGRRIVVLTDRGQVNTYEIGPQSDQSALNLVATRPAGGRRSEMQHALLHDRSIWVADTQLTKYAVQPTDNRLVFQNIEENYSGCVFDYPLQLIGQTLIHLRRLQQRQGAAVAALELPSGEVRWETDLGVPPVGSPLIDAPSQTIVSANANGDVFILDRQAIRSRVQDQPVVAANAPVEPPVLSHEVSLDGGRAVYSSQSGSPWVMLYEHEPGKRSARWIEMPSPLAAPPARLGGGFLAPLEIGQVILLSSADGSPAAAPFQPRVEAGTRIPWSPIGTSPELGDKCVLADGRERIYLLSLEEGPYPSLHVEREGEFPGFELRGRITIVKNRALLGTPHGKLAIFELPSLQLAEEISLSGRQIVWGPYAVGDRVLLATDENQLHSIAADGNEAWQLPLTHGELAGPPTSSEESVLLAYRTGELQRLMLSNGEVLGEIEIGQPLASGPASFQQRYVVAAHDGTLLVVDPP